MVAIQVRPASGPAEVPIPATPELTGGPEDREAIKFLTAALEKSELLRSASFEIPVPASGESIQSFYFRVRQKTEALWRRSVRRGTGVVLDATGHVATTATLLRYRGDGESIFLQAGGEWVPAKVVGVDRFTGVAVLSGARPESATVQLPATAPVQAGQFLFSLQRNARGELTSQWGSVSASARRVPDLEDVGYVPFLETTLRLLPGAAGSPAFDLSGNLVGLLVEARREESSFLTYALPAPVLHDVVGDLIGYGRYRHGFLGVEIRIPDSREDQTRRQELKAPDDVRGVMLKAVWAGEAAEAAGLAIDDLIVSIDGQSLEDWRDLIWRIHMHAPGATVDLEVWRSGEVKHFPVTVGKPRGQRTP